MDVKKILVTGSAGFIGFHLCKKLAKQGFSVVGIDNINDYYDIKLKHARLKELGFEENKTKIFLKKNNSSIYGKKLKFVRINLEDEENLPKLFKEENFDVVCNLAAQAGVRHSIINPKIYIKSNINGFLNILECCRNNHIKRLIYASSSSVYGNIKSTPLTEADKVDKPISLYAATKKSNELMAHTYSHLYDIETIGLRFFTVYGPWGRPDMAYFLFTEAILNKQPIQVFNNGDLYRDFTYIDDIIKGVLPTILQKPVKKYQLLNIGHSNPVKLLDFIKEIELNLGKKAKKNMLPMQPGDVNKTWADIEKIKKRYDYKTKTSIKEGIKSFIDWYKQYYN